MRTVLVGPAQRSLCWSRWARWLDAADRGSEAGRWREDRPGRAETRGRVPCRRAGSTWFQQDSAPLGAFQSPARGRANTHDSGLSLGLLSSAKTQPARMHSIKLQRIRLFLQCCPKALPANFSTLDKMLPQRGSDSQTASIHSLNRALGTLRATFHLGFLTDQADN